MRARALFGGFAILAAVALLHRPSSQPGAARAESLPGCSASAPGTFCDAITRLGKTLRDPALPFHRTNILPPPETPGAIDPGVTQANIDTTICRSGYARSVRPAYATTGPLKRRLMDVEYPGQSMADYELDHLIPISLGGAPFDRRDLWLQPRGGQANAGAKNVLAYVLWRLVCEHRLPLATAQTAIRDDWTRAYQQYATPENIARYHFRHADHDRE